MRTTTKSTRFTIGIDLGGTKIATGLVDTAGRLLAMDRRPSQSPNDATLSVRRRIQYCVEEMADSVLAVLQDQAGKTTRQKAARIKGIGFAAAGPLNVDRGLLVHPYNFAGWKVVPVVAHLAEALKKRDIRIPIHFQNDAIAAALGEGWVGRAKGCTSYAMITLGTGVGTGVILNGRPAQSKGMGSEWGHMMIDHGILPEHEPDPYLATVEGVASGTGLVRLARAHGLSCLNSEELAIAARAGNPLALKTFAQASRALAGLFYNLSIGFHLDKFVFTGGLLPIQDLFIPRAIELYRLWIDNTAPDFRAPVVTSKLGNKAGVIGAARLPYIK